MQKINLVSGKEYKKDNTTVYDVANGSRVFSIPLSTVNTWSIQAIWNSLNKTDGKIEVYGSNDNTNWDLLPSASKIMNSATSSYTFIKDEFNWDYVALKYTAGTVTAGTLKLILKMKK